MTCQTFHAALTVPASRRRTSGRLWTFVKGLFGPHHARLEPEAMPDHMKRDLGFLDGRDPRYERAETR